MGEEGTTLQAWQVYSGIATSVLIVSDVRMVDKLPQAFSWVSGRCLPTVTTRLLRLYSVW